MPFIREHQGYKINYDLTKHQFYAEDKEGQTVAEAKTEAEVEGFLKKLTKKVFKRIPTIERGHLFVRVGEITSVVKEAGHHGRGQTSVWFMYRDERGRAQRSKINLAYKDLFRQTTENMEVVHRIQALVTQVKRLEEEIDAAMEELTSPITEENIFEGGE